MKLFYDPNKNIKNIEERDLNFERVLEFDFSSAKFWQDERKPYLEARYVALGYLDNRLHVYALAMRLEVFA